MTGTEGKKGDEHNSQSVVVVVVVSRMRRIGGTEPEGDCLVRPDAPHSHSHRAPRYAGGLTHCKIGTPPELTQSRY